MRWRTHVMPAMAPEAMTDRIEISEGDPREEGAAALLTASNALMEALFDPEANHAMGPGELSREDVLFLVARHRGEVAGTGALVERGGYGEIKAMFVAPEKRGLGVAAALLARLEEAARERGLPVLRLETGDALEEAVRLYARAGFRPCGPFGPYGEDARSLFMEKRLGDA